MVGWHHWPNGHEFEQALGVGDGQGSLACCSPWGRKESDMTEQLNWNLNQPACWTWTSQPLKLWERNFYCLSHLGYDIFVIETWTKTQAVNEVIYFNSQQSCMLTLAAPFYKWEQKMFWDMKCHRRDGQETEVTASPQQKPTAHTPHLTDSHPAWEATDSHAGPQTLPLLTFRFLWILLFQSWA